MKTPDPALGTDVPPAALRAVPRVASQLVRPAPQAPHVTILVRNSNWHKGIESSLLSNRIVHLPATQRFECDGTAERALGRCLSVRM